MNSRLPLAIGVLLLGGCAADNPPVNPAAGRSTAQLLNTYWKLMQLGDQVVNAPSGTREIHFVLHAENQRVAGFSGCNQMMGNYVLEGASLRFSQMGGTLMACAPERPIEREFMAMFSDVARWEITGESLRLLDADGRTLATFESRYLK